MAEIEKKNSVILLIVAIVLAVIVTFGILNSTPIQPDVVEDVDNSAKISLTIEEPDKYKDESTSKIQLEVLPAGG